MFNNVKKIEKKDDLTNTSNFILTVNTNSSDENSKNKLNDCMESILNNFDKFLTPKNEAYGIKLQNNITKTAAQYSIEKAPKAGAWHAHALIEIHQKKGIYHVNLNLLREALESQFGYTPYVNVKWYKDSSEAIKRYISKTF